MCRNKHSSPKIPPNDAYSQLPVHSGDKPIPDPLPLIVRNSTPQPQLPQHTTQPPSSHGPDLSLPMPPPSLFWNTTVAPSHPPSWPGTHEVSQINNPSLTVSGSFHPNLQLLPQSNSDVLLGGIYLWFEFPNFFIKIMTNAKIIRT